MSGPTHDAETTVVGVIGHPIRHSLSPLLYNAAFVEVGLNWVMHAFEVAPGSAAGALEGMRALGLPGLSVTMPHKADVAAAVDQRSEVAERLGAVNCVVNRGGALWGTNTDGAGFLASLQRGAGFEPSGARCLVIGAGGAARAVVLALAEGGSREVAVVNRTRQRADVAAALAVGSGRVIDPSELGELMETAAQADLVVNATPVGMSGVGEAAGEWLVAPGLLHAGQMAADLVYAPRPTPWLAAAAAAGATAVDGLGMLVHQAAAQFELWTGAKAPVEAMWRAAADAVSSA